MKVALRLAPPYRSLRQTGTEKLSGGDHPMLATGNSGDLLLD
jgi:hypothetical protein